MDIEQGSLEQTQTTANKDYWLAFLKKTVAILVLIFFIMCLYMYLMLNSVFEGDMDLLLFEMRDKPGKLALLFQAVYILAAVFMIPSPPFQTFMAFAYTHIYGVKNGVFIAYILNYVCYNVASTFVFLMTRLYFGELVHSRLVSN